MYLKFCNTDSYTLEKKHCCINSPLPQALIDLLFEIELHEVEEALGCLGLVGEVPVVLEEVAEEGEEDLKGVNSVEGEAVEVGGADMCAPSPGKFTWAMTTASHGLKWTNQDVTYAVSMEIWFCVVTMTVDLLCFVMSHIWRIKVVVIECVFKEKSGRN